MPELPEVETVRLGLTPVMAGAQIQAIQLNRADLRFPFPKNFSKILTGRTITQVDRRAKYLLIHTSQPRSKDQTLIAHLGMSGRFIIEGGQKNQGKSRNPSHDHVAIKLLTAKGHAVRVLYNDPRRFGFMDLVARDALEHCRHFAAMGPEPLGNQFHGASLRSALSGRKTAIKQALLDQRVVAGLGNIYVCEALWQAGISPRRRAHSLGPQRAARLVTAIREILRAAIASGGSSLKDHAAVDGKLGYFQHGFKAYGREGEACARCGGAIRRYPQAGRSTFACGHCQR